MAARSKPSLKPRPMRVADAHALADRLERHSRFFGTYNDVHEAVAVIRALLRGRAAGEIIEMEK